MHVQQIFITTQPDFNFYKSLLAAKVTKWLQKSFKRLQKGYNLPEKITVLLPFIDNEKTL